ncbi:MAG: hypothetical protein NVSMB25_25790 [Thermoleophilaceae bacterium]
MNGGEQRDPDPQNKLPPCFVQPPSLYDGRQFPHVDRGVVRRAPSPSRTFQPNDSASPNRPLTSGR